MNILYINHYAGSKHLGMEFRPYYLGTHWKKMGHQVFIIASSFTHLRVRQPEIDGALTHEKIDGLDFFWIKGVGYVGNGVGRFINICQFLMRLFRYRKTILKKCRPDVIIASSTYPMDIWAAKHLAKLSGAQLVFELHDVWPQSLTEVAGLPRWHPMVLIAAAAEKACYRYADRIISLLPAIHGHAAEMGFDLNRLSIVPNGVVADDWLDDGSHELPSSLSQIISAFKRKGHIIVCYAGAHGVPNALDNLLNAAELLKDEPVSFLLVGEGNHKANLRSTLKKLDLKNVVMHEGISKVLIPELLAHVDVGFIGAKDKPIYDHGISPNKIVDYMMAELPVICAINAGNDLVADAQSGFSVPPNDHQLLASVIIDLIYLGDEGRVQIGKRGKQHVLQNYSYDVLANRFLEALN
jgi:glycosyltransferase involved in cell wall biosynthesis